MFEPFMQPIKHEFTDFLIYWPGIRVGVKETNLLTGELYLWVDRVDSPSLAALRRMRRVFDTIQLPMVCNVDARNEATRRFAEFFGFAIAHTTDNVHIMTRN
jgi:hypothetical protein